mgnify:CR=1 FL=1
MSSAFCDRLRAFEERILANLDKIKCPVHLSLGSEAVCEAIYKNVRPQDWLFGSHRSHGPYLAKGGSEDRLWDEICGLETGINSGRAGSQCFSDPSINFHASSIVGGSIGVAVGAALALRGSGNIVVCHFGDAATEQGVFWEAIGFAALKRLPILFICENNGLSINVPINERQPSKEGRQVSIWWRVATWGITTPKSIEEGFKIARNTGPAFVEIAVKREGEHCYFPLSKPGTEK